MKLNDANVKIKINEKVLIKHIIYDLLFMKRIADWWNHFYNIWFISSRMECNEMKGYNADGYISLIMISGQDLWID